MFYVTVKYMMPKSRVVIRHIMQNLTVNETVTRVKGFKILLSQKELQWAIHAVMFTDPVSEVEN